MEDIYELIQSALEKGERGALASVVWRKGSAPMSADAKMAILRPGGRVKVLACPHSHHMRRE